MQKRSILFLALLSLLCSSSYAQDLKIESFKKLERDLLARTQERLDLNDEPCAIIRISAADVKSFKFEGNIIGEITYNTGEAIVYMTAQTRNITIKNEKYGTMKYEFPERLEKSVVYKLELKLIISEDKKTRTLVMPVVGVGSVPSYGIMIGLVKKSGAYLKVKYNFMNFSSDFECDNDGKISGSNDYPWFNGDTSKTRLSITGGLLQRLWRPFYLYVGAGYGYSNYGWKTNDGKWAKITDYSHSGYEAEFGGIYRVKNIAISAGYQTNQFKYHEATIGVGIMF